MPPVMGEERRSSSRQPLATPQAWRLSTSLNVRILDISVGGALMAASRPFAQGEDFTLRLMLGQRPCIARGTVVRTEKDTAAPGNTWLVGVSFREWEGDSQERLRDYLNRSVSFGG